jgi:hypothetical protein
VNGQEEAAHGRFERKNGGVPRRKRVNKPLNEQKNHLSALFESLITAIFADDLFINSPHRSPLSLSGFDFFLSYWVLGAESARYSLPTRPKAAGDASFSPQ